MHRKRRTSPAKRKEKKQNIRAQQKSQKTTKSNFKQHRTNHDGKPYSEKKGRIAKRFR